jgi:hypothetical protein
MLRFIAVVFFSFSSGGCAAYVGEWLGVVPAGVNVARERETHSLYNTDSEGNELFVRGNAAVYFSGSFPYKSEPIHKALGCVTMAHIVLGDNTARELIAACKVYDVLHEFFFKDQQKDVRQHALAVIDECYNSGIGTDYLLGVDLRNNRLFLREKLFNYNWNGLQHNVIDLRNAIGVALRNYFYNLRNYCQSCLGEAGLILADDIWQDVRNLSFFQLMAAPLSEPVRLGVITHTERMLLYYLYNGNIAWPQYIFSKKAMCPNCEDAMVRAWRSSGRIVYVISETKDNDRKYDGSPVKKICVP